MSSEGEEKKNDQKNVKSGPDVMHEQIYKKDFIQIISEILSLPLFL